MEKDFEWLDFSGAGISYNITLSGNSVYFKSAIKKIVTRKGLTNVRLRRDRCTNKIWFVFNKDGEGMKINSSIKSTQPLYIGNKKLLEFLLYAYDGKKKMKLSEDQSNSENYATFEILE